MLIFSILCEMEPSFIALKELNTSATTDPHISNDVIIENTAIPNITHQYFYSCSVQIKSTTFQNCYAFGGTIESGNGGAFYSINSEIYFGNSNFDRNKASLGGAIALTNNNIIIEHTNFTNNLAFISGGGIFCECVQKSHKFFSVSNCKFAGNNGGDDGGALSIFNYDIIYIDNTNFNQNKAMLRGGAIFAQKTSIILSEAVFNKNILDITSNFKKDNFTNHQSYSFRGRGGGAIYFFPKDSPTPETFLDTRDCQFLDNGLSSGTNLNPDYSNPGYHLMFDGNAVWISNHDKFKPCLLKNSYAHVRRENQSVVLIQQLNATQDDCSEAIDLSAPASFAFASTEKSTDTHPTNIPSPSTFTYLATPITKLPHATTSSYNTNSQTKTMTQKLTIRSNSFTPLTYSTPVATKNPLLANSTYLYNYIQKETSTISFTSYTTELSSISTNLYINASTLTLSVHNETLTYETTYTLVRKPTTIAAPINTTIFIPYETNTATSIINQNATVADKETEFYVHSWMNTDTSIPSVTLVFTLVPIFSSVTNPINGSEYFSSQEVSTMTITNGSLTATNTTSYTKTIYTTQTQNIRALKETPNNLYTANNFDISLTYTVTKIQSNVGTFITTTKEFKLPDFSKLPVQSEIDLNTTNISTLTTKCSNVTSFIPFNFKNGATSTSFVTYVNTSSFFKMYIFDGTSAGTTYTYTATFVETAILLAPNQVTSVANTTLSNTTTATVTLITTAPYLGLSKSITASSTEIISIGNTIIDSYTNKIYEHSGPFMSENLTISTLSKTYSMVLTNITHLNTSTSIYVYTEVNTLTNIESFIYDTQYEVGINESIETMAASKVNITYYSWTAVSTTLNLFPQATENVLYSLKDTTVNETYTLTETKSFAATSWNSPPTFILSSIKFSTNTFTFFNSIRTYTYTEIIDYAKTENSQHLTSGLTSTIKNMSTYVPGEYKISTYAYKYMLTAISMDVNSIEAEVVNISSLKHFQFEYQSTTLLHLYTQSLTTKDTFIQLGNSYFWTSSVITNTTISFYSLITAPLTSNIFTLDESHTIYLKTKLVPKNVLTTTTTNTPAPTIPPATPEQTPGKTDEPLKSSDGQTVTKTLTNSLIESNSQTVVNTTILTVINSEVKDANGKKSFIETFTFIATQVISYTTTFLITVVEKEIYVKSGITSAFLIGAVTAGLAVFFIIAAIALYLYRSTYQNNESDFYSTESSMETTEDTDVEPTRTAYFTNDDQIIPAPDDIAAPIENYDVYDDDLKYINNDDF